MKRPWLTNARVTLLATALAGTFVLAGVTAGRLLLREDAAADTDDHPIQGPQRVSQVHGETRIMLDAAAQRQAGILTQRLTSASRSTSLRAYGTVLDAQSLSDLANRYANGRAQLEIAQARLDGARLALERARSLYADRQNISAAQLQAAESSYRTERSNRAAAQSQISTLGASAQQSWGQVLGESLIKSAALAGRVISRQVLLVQVTLRPGETAPSAPAGAYVRGDDGSHIALDYLSPATRTDPRIQGASLLFTAPATSGLLPGMSVLVLVPTAGGLTGALVPPSAVIWTQGASWAYFRNGPDGFVRRRVPTENAQPDGYLVSAPAGGEVVVQGAQMLLSEEQRALVRVDD